MNFFIGVIAGIVITLVLISFYADYKLKQQKKELKKHLDDFVKLGERYKALQEKMKMSSLNHQKSMTPQQERVLESKLYELDQIGQRLFNIDIAVQQPSKNQQHSLYKNSLIREAKELGERRDVIIQELWDSGFNPLIKVKDNDGNLTTKYLRDLLAEAMSKNEKKEEQPEKKKSHLRLIKDEE